MVDKDLFLHDLAVVAILKNEGHYLKEWIDYHLLAGVDHFYLYDNESPDNQAEVAKPYVEAGLVDYILFPGEGVTTQLLAYNDAIKRFRFQSRYLAFIDCDEFIYPKSRGGVVELIDELLSHDPKAMGLSIHWQLFGSNGQEKADYSRGVLERFTRRAPKDYTRENKPENVHMPDNCYVKVIANPRKVDLIKTPHKMEYFLGYYSIAENLKYADVRPGVVADKIVLNHYFLKSREEFFTRVKGGTQSKGKIAWFDICDRNDEFDDGILKYRDARAEAYKQPDNSHANDRLIKALLKNLSPTLLTDTPPDFYKGKTETFLMCRAVASYFKERSADDISAKFFEETALKAVLKSLDKMSVPEAQLLIREMPNLLKLPYPVVKDLRTEVVSHIPQIRQQLPPNNIWRDLLNYIRDFLGG